jgi:hypothetical protein
MMLRGGIEAKEHLFARFLDRKRANPLAIPIDSVL